MKDIEIIDIDYSAKDPAFKKEDEVEVAKISGPWIIPEEGPVYADSVRVLKGGLDLIPGTDFEPVEEVTDLSLKTGKKVVLYVKLKAHILQGGGKLDMIYQRVGLPIISTKKLIETLEEMVIKGKPVDWETGVQNKPKTYYPSWHSHDIKNSNELVGFGGLVELFSRLTWEQGNEGTKMQALLQALQTEMYNKLDYVHKLKWGAIMDHSRNYNNPHGVVPGNVNAGNLNNYATATPQEDSEGKRDDLRSTPAGLSRMISEQSPETEDYLVQNELPFGYYGSGIYLPPPITGSFEGLGSDVENSAFVKEGNGWTVGLIRGYDGRVKNLYYIYNEDILDRTGRSKWLHTYVQYKHNTISAEQVPDPTPEDPNHTRDKYTANMIMSGSNQSVICIGDVKEGNQQQVTGQDRWWIGITNSTMDPSSHTLKPINITDVVNETPLTNGRQAGYGAIFHVGDWVYYIHNYQDLKNDDPAYTGAAGINNWESRMWRFRYSDLSNTAVTSITLQPVNVTYDNLDRQRRSGRSMFMIRHHTNAAGQLVEGAIKYSYPIRDCGYHRRRQFIVVPNPNNPRYARVKVLCVSYSNVKNRENDGVRGLWQDLVIDYDWDVETNTWTLHSSWRKPTLDVDTNTWIDINRDWNQGFGHAQHTNRFVYTAGSYIPGVGFASLESLQTGVPPFHVGVSQINRDGDPRKDYDWMLQPINWWDSVNRHNAWSFPFIMKSPFGVAGFPRFYSDIYQMTDGLRTTPIEIFFAENEGQGQSCYYRITEGGAGNDYTARTGLQSRYIDRPLYGRATNSNFGTVNGLTYNIGMAHRPRRKNSTSRGTGLFSYVRRNVQANPGAPNDFTWRINDQGQQIQLPIESNGDIIINIDMDYRLDGPTKVLFVRPNKAKQVRVPRSLWQDMVKNAMGSHYARVLDMGVSFYISAQPGSGGDQPFSMWQVTYHLSDSPEDTRSIIGMFTWSQNGSVDGIPVVKFDNMQYPFTASGNAARPLKPGTDANISAQGPHHAINPNGSWSFIGYGVGLSVKYQHMEILDFESEGPQNLEQCWLPGLQINVPGNMTGLRIFFKRRNNVISEATAEWSANNAFNWEYGNQVQANSQWGWLSGVASEVSGGAMDLMQPWKGPLGQWPVVQDKYILLGATYVEGNWSVFINSEVTVTFNGFSMMAKMQNWDLRELSDEYRNQVFYIYCCANGSGAYYEVTKVLRNHDANKILVATVRTNNLGIYEIERAQTFTISGFPIIRTRNMGVPASSGALTEQGNYQFLKRSDLFAG